MSSGLARLHTCAAVGVWSWCHHLQLRRRCCRAFVPGLRLQGWARATPRGAAPIALGAVVAHRLRQHNASRQ